MDPISGAEQAAGDVGSALVNQSTDEAVANEQAQGQEALNKQNFNEETNYTEQQEQALRDAIMGVAQNYGNPYAAAQQYIPAPQAASGGSFGGTTYSGANNGAAATPAASNGSGQGGSSASSGLAQGISGQPRYTQPVARRSVGAQ